MNFDGPQVQQSGSYSVESRETTVNPGTKRQQSFVPTHLRRYPPRSNPSRPPNKGNGQEPSITQTEPRIDYSSEQAQQQRRENQRISEARGVRRD